MQLAIGEARYWQRPLTFRMARARDTPGSPTSWRVFLPRIWNFCLLTFTSNGFGLVFAGPPKAPAGALWTCLRAPARFAFPMTFTRPHFGIQCLQILQTAAGCLKKRVRRLQNHAQPRLAITTSHPLPREKYTSPVRHGTGAFVNQRLQLPGGNTAELPGAGRYGICSVP